MKQKRHRNDVEHPKKGQLIHKVSQYQSIESEKKKKERRLNRFVETFVHFLSEQLNYTIPSIIIIPIINNISIGFFDRAKIRQKLD